MGDDGARKMDDGRGEREDEFENRRSPFRITVIFFYCAVLLFIIEVVYSSKDYTFLQCCGAGAEIIFLINIF